MSVSRRRSSGSESPNNFESSYGEADNLATDGETNTTIESCSTGSNFEERKIHTRVIDYEREEGDGQEYESDNQTITSASSEDGEDQQSIAPKSEKKLDDDEDRRNPQYIPKRGTFYEHDDRTADDDGSVNDAEKDAERAKELLEKKKVWKEHENRWDHDKFIDDEQTPKTREELIELYGYDIRSEEGPPRARRRRRYGRGPNKYTRNWEDEDAYNKPTLAPTQGRGRRGSGPRGEGDRYENEDQGPNGQRSQDDLRGYQRRSEERSLTFYSNKVSGRRDDKRESREAFPALPGADSSRNDRRSPREDRPVSNAPTNPAWKKESPQQNRVQGSNSGPLQLTPPPVRRDRRQDEGRLARDENNLPDFEHVRKGAGRGVLARRGKSGDHNAQQVTSRGMANVQRGVYRGRASLGRSQDNRESRSEPPGDKAPNFQSGQGPKLRTQDDLANDLARMTIYNQNQSVHSQEQPQLSSREFTRRQQADANKGGGSYQRQVVVPPRLQQEAAANRPKRYSSLRQRSVPEAGVPSVQPQPYGQPTHQYYQGGYVQQPVYADAPPPSLPTQMIHPPATFTAAFIQPAPAPHLMRRPPSPHYLPQPPPNLFVQSQPQFPPQPYPPFQGYTSVNPAPPPPTELYQPQGGITYYSPEEQIMPRAITRRQRLAIPIVPPPERQPRGRGRMLESEMYDVHPSEDRPDDDYGGTGNISQINYDNPSDQYQDYEGPGDQPRLDCETFERQSPTEYKGSDHLRSEYEVCENDLQSVNYKVSKDHLPSNNLGLKDDLGLNNELAENQSQSNSTGDISPTDNEVSKEVTQLDLETTKDNPDHKATEGRFLSDSIVGMDDAKPKLEFTKDHLQSDLGASGDKLSSSLEVSVASKTVASCTERLGSRDKGTAPSDGQPSQDGGGDRAKSSASDEKYEDAAELVPQEIHVEAS